MQGKLMRGLRGARTRRLWALRELVARSGVSLSEVGRLERGEHAPTTATARKLARALGVPLEQLFEAPNTPGEPTRSEA